MMDTKKTTDRFELMALMGALVEGDESNPLQDWVTLIPDGEVKSSQGDFVLDAQAAATVIANHEQSGNDLPIDYEHQSLGGDYTSPSGQAPAAGWIKKLKYVAGVGLRGLVRWGASAAEQIRNAMYRYMSPVVVVDKDTHRAVALHSLGLTNTPAIHNFPPLSEFRRVINTDRLILQDQPQGQPQDTAQSVDTLIVDIRELLSLPADATPEDILAAAIEALKAASASASQPNAVTASLGLKPDADTTEVIAAITRLTQSTVSKDEWFRLKKELVDKESQELINHYAMQGKLTASMEKHQLEKLRSGVDGFEDRKKEFVALMDSLPVIIPQGATQPPTGGGPPQRQTVINKASREFDAQPQLKKLTNRAAFVDLALREEGLALLTADERAKQG